MQSTFGPPDGIVAAALVVGVLLAAVVPTCLYLYVEPRGRLSWGVAGDTRDTRRAPAVVRTTAWLSFAVGQLAIPWLLLPIACALLLYLQAKLGVGRLLGPVATMLVGAIAIAQSLLALRLLPLGVRLLARDPKATKPIRRIARRNAVANALLLGLGMLTWGVASAPGLVHPWLRAVLGWTALRPEIGYAALGLLHALMLGRCAVILDGASQTNE
jgi:hypothetical protein